MKDTIRDLKDFQNIISELINSDSTGFKSKEIQKWVQKEKVLIVTSREEGRYYVYAIRIVKKDIDGYCVQFTMNTNSFGGVIPKEYRFHISLHMSVYDVGSLLISLEQKLAVEQIAVREETIFHYKPEDIRKILYGENYE